MMKALGKKRKLKNFGNAVFPKSPIKKKESTKPIISKENVVDFKILLETEKDFDEFLSKL
jgi:hypothetical protein